MLIKKIILEPLRARPPIGDLACGSYVPGCNGLCVIVMLHSRVSCIRCWNCRPDSLNWIVKYSMQSRTRYGCRYLYRNILFMWQTSQWPYVRHCMLLSAAKCFSDSDFASWNADKNGASPVTLSDTSHRVISEYRRFLDTLLRYTFAIFVGSAFTG